MTKIKPNQSSPFLPNPGQSDCAAQPQTDTLQIRFLADFSYHAGHDVLAGFQFPSESVVLAEMVIVGPAVAMHEQNTTCFRVKYVAEGGENGGVTHDFCPFF